MDEEKIRKRKRRRRLSRILSVLCCLLLFLSLALYEYYRVYKVNPYEIQTEYKRLEDQRIPAELDGVSIVFISDIEYGEYIHEGHLQQLFEQINTLDPDIFLFGGDLFAKSYRTNAQAISMMQDYLSSIEAPLGKFAVYGEQDLVDAQRKNIIDSIYFNSQIEVLQNNSVELTNGSAAFIRLIGLDLQADFHTALQGVDGNNYNIVLSHYPDHLLDESLQTIGLAYALAGNSHGTQILWPMYGGYRIWEGSSELNRGKPAALPFEYEISPGIGCIAVNARMNSTPTITYYLLG